MSKNLFVAIVGLCFAAAASISIADEGGQDNKFRQGTLRCGGNNFLRAGGTEIQFTSYTFRNWNTTKPITIRRLVFFAANGDVLFDTNTNGFPTFNNGILGPSDNVLDANQTAQLDTIGLLPFLAGTQRPIQMEVEWSAPERVLMLRVGGSRISRAIDTTGQQGSERGRDSAGCETISLRK